MKSHKEKHLSPYRLQQVWMQFIELGSFKLICSTSPKNYYCHLRGYKKIKKQNFIIGCKNMQVKFNTVIHGTNGDSILPFSVFYHKKRIFQHFESRAHAWVTFVRSKQSMQFVLTTPSCASSFSPVSFTKKYLPYKITTKYKAVKYNHNI